MEKFYKYFFYLICGSVIISWIRMIFNIIPPNMEYVADATYRILAVSIIILAYLGARYFVIKFLYKKEIKC